MKLSAYLKHRGITGLAFAEMIGVAPSTITRLATGSVPRKPGTMLLIYEKTGGLVTPNDFFDIDPAPSARSMRRKQQRSLAQ